MIRRTFLRLLGLAPALPLIAKLPAIAAPVAPIASSGALDLDMLLSSLAQLKANRAARGESDNIEYFGGPSQVAEFRTNYTDALARYYREKYGDSIEAPILQCDVDWARSHIP